MPDSRLRLKLTWEKRALMHSVTLPSSGHVPGCSQESSESLICIETGEFDFFVIVFLCEVEALFSILDVVVN